MGFPVAFWTNERSPPHTLTAWGEDSLCTLSMQEGHDWWIGHARSATAFFKIASIESNIKSVRPTEMLYFVNPFKARLPLRIFLPCDLHLELCIKLTRASRTNWSKTCKHMSCCIRNGGARGCCGGYSRGYSIYILYLLENLTENHGCEWAFF